LVGLLEVRPGELQRYVPPSHLCLCPVLNVVIGDQGLALGAICSILALLGETILFVIRGTKMDAIAQKEAAKAKRDGPISPFGEAGTPFGKEVVEDQKVIGFDTPQEYVNTRIREESILASAGTEEAKSLLKKLK